MAKKKADINAKQQSAILALMRTDTIAKAATAIGVGRRTLDRWLKDTDFVAAYREAQRQVFSVSMAQLQRLTGRAVDELGKVLRDKKTPARTKVTAARTILENARAAIELDDISARLEAMERLLNELEK